MGNEHAFKDIIKTKAEIRAIVGEPSLRVLKKELTRLDEHCRAFIAKSPFLLIASSDAEGRMDISPKGDPPGFVHVLDDQTLVIPDRPGNRRADSFCNILQEPHVGLFFLIPGKQETLRVSGRAVIVRDFSLREKLAERGKLPDLVLGVSVERAFFHCAKCVIRSGIWDAESWPDQTGLPTLARTMVDAGKLEESVEEMQALIDRDAAARLY